jgi:hypothetical protein
MDDQFISEETLYAQLEFLGARPPSRLTLSDWARQGLFPRPRGAGGRGMRREYHAVSAAEIHAGMALILAAGGTVSRAQVRYIRELALIIEGCRSPKDILAIAQGFSRGAEGKDISAMGPDIIMWLRQKRKALRTLYKNQPDVEKRRDEYFDSPQFVRLVWGLTNGFFEGYRFEGNRLITPQKKTSVESEALKNFPKESAGVSL